MKMRDEDDNGRDGANKRGREWVILLFVLFQRTANRCHSPFVSLLILYLMRVLSTCSKFAFRSLHPLCQGVTRTFVSRCNENVQNDNDELNVFANVKHARDTVS